MSKFCFATLVRVCSRFLGKLFALTVVTTSTSPPLTERDFVSRLEVACAEEGRFFFRLLDRDSRSWCCFNMAICSPLFSIRATSWSSSRSRSSRRRSSSVSWICLSSSLCSLAKEGKREKMRGQVRELNHAFFSKF